MLRFTCLAMIMITLATVGALAQNPQVGRQDGQTRTASITGTVTNTQNEPLDLATVRLMRTVGTDNPQQGDTMVTSTYSDHEGHYVFQTLPPGNYFVEASLIGHSTKISEPVRIDANSRSATINFQLLFTETQLEA